MSNTALKRIEKLLDPNSFVEIGGSVTARSTDYNGEAKKEASDGVVCGYGTIDGSLVYVYGQDPDVLGGSLGEMHGRKIMNIYRMAEKMGAPVVGMLDSTGIRIEESMDALAVLGGIFRKQSSLSGVIPQITGVFGKCGGGMALIPAISDFTFIESDSAKLFINSPDAIKGSNINKLDNTKAAYQSENGNVDFIGSEDEILAEMRSLIAMLPSNYADDGFTDVCTDDINRDCSGIEAYADDTLGIAQCIADNGVVVECGKDFAPNMLTAFIKLNGNTVGVIANRKSYMKGEELCNEFNGELTARALNKAASFIRFLDAFNIPVVTVANASGFYGMECTEKCGPGAAARLIYAYADAVVPKVTLNIGESYGSAAVIMGSRSVGADIVYAWDNALIGAMRPDEAAKILCEGKDNADIKETQKKFSDMQLSAASAASRGYVDTIIAPCDTRKYIIGALEMLYSKREDRIDKKHGTV